MRTTNIKPQETIAEATARHRLIHTMGTDERMVKETRKYVTECIEDAIYNGLYSTILIIEGDSDSIVVRRASYAMAIAERMGCRLIDIRAIHPKQKRRGRITIEVALTTQGQDDVMDIWRTELKYQEGDTNHED